MSFRPAPHNPGGLAGQAVSPVPGLTLCPHADSSLKGWVLGEVPKKFRVQQCLRGRDLRGLYDEEGVYEVCFEKQDRIVRVRVGGRTVKEVELTPRQNEAAAGRTVVFKIFGAAQPFRAVHVRATLLEFSCSGDCVSRR